LGVIVEVSRRLNAWGRVCEVLLTIFSKSTGFIKRSNLGYKALVKAENGIVLLNEGQSNGFFLGVVKSTNTRVISESSYGRSARLFCRRDIRTGHIEMSCIRLINHSTGYIWNIASRVRLARHIDLKILDAKDIFEVQKEINEVLSDLFFIRGSDFSN
jgi:hypothetical protein